MTAYRTERQKKHKERDKENNIFARVSMCASEFFRLITNKYVGVRSKLSEKSSPILSFTFFRTFIRQSRVHVCAKRLSIIFQRFRLNTKRSENIQYFVFCLTEIYILTWRLSRADGEGLSK